jgi:hypothetical protein
MQRRPEPNGAPADAAAADAADAAAPPPAADDAAPQPPTAGEAEVAAAAAAALAAEGGGESKGCGAGRWGGSAPLLRWGCERFCEACWRRDNPSRPAPAAAAAAGEAEGAAGPGEGGDAGGGGGAWSAECMEEAWAEAVEACRGLRVTEKADCWGWAVCQVRRDARVRRRRRVRSGEGSDVG